MPIFKGIIFNIFCKFLDVLIEGIEISTDKSRLQIRTIHTYLSKHSYWAQGRTIEEVEICIDNSICFGVYLNKSQIGFARIVSDLAVFAWIMDVYILPEFQRHGYGENLMEAVFSYEPLFVVKHWGLKTNDAHELYRKFGFDSTIEAQKIMELNRLLQTLKE